MGLGFALVFHILILGLLVAVLWPVFWLLRKIAKIEGRTGRRIIRLIHFAIAGAPIALFIAGIVWLNIAPPTALYRQVFGMPVDATVENLRGSSSASNDFQWVFLAFTASEDTFAQILDSVGGYESTNGNLVPLPSADRPPAWWTAPQCERRSTYVGRVYGRWDDLVVTRCDDDSTIYGEARWIN